ncbi:MAG: DUF393 domain-containing protein [Bacteroidetes bacterium]|nr:MAG: DUF393 domain-containing protein [Bacteroidota bacterium]
MEKTNTQLKNPIVLFDGYCHLCDGSISFIVKKEKGSKLRFTPLQGETFKSLQASIPFNPIPDSILLYENGKWYAESGAVLRIARYLKQPYRLAYSFLIIPRFLRDFIYKLVARYRYAWFGKRSSCRMPEPHERQRFLP